MHYCGIRLTAIDRPSDYKELFNLRHAQARNVIERVFGVVKRRFRIMGIGPEYNLDTQTLLISAVCVLHNFIRIHDPGDLDGADINAELERRAPRRSPEDFGRSIIVAERTRASQKRDEIAKAMWAQYIAYTQQN